PDPAPSPDRRDFAPGAAHTAGRGSGGGAVREIRRNLSLSSGGLVLISLRDAADGILADPSRSGPLQERKGDFRERRRQQLTAETKNMRVGGPGPPTLMEICVNVFSRRVFAGCRPEKKSFSYRFEFLMRSASTASSASSARVWSWEDR